MKLLIVDDNIQLVESLRDSLKDLFRVDWSYTGIEGVQKATAHSYGAIVLDLDLPDKNGLEVCREIRAAQVRTPILILSGAQDTDKKVSLLDAGADDYITKPFHADELRARLQALIRRSSTAATNSLDFNGLRIDVTDRTVTYDNQQIELRRMEFDILEYLVRNSGRVLTREMISSHVAATGRENWSNAVDVHIKRLRDKLEPLLGERLITTIYGVGYTIKSRS